MINLEIDTRHFAQRFLGAFTRNLPPDLQPWGDAMLAEVPVVKGTVSPLIWALGGSMFLSKTLISRWFSGERFRGPQFRDGEPLSPLQKAAFAAIVLSFAMLLSPMFRQAVATSLTAWTSTNQSREFRDAQSASLQNLIREAENTREANLIAAAAMHVQDHRQAIALAGKATQLDARLTWIWYVMIERFSFSLPQTEQDRFIHDKAAILEAWDSSNAVPWIVDAHQTRMHQGGVFASSNAVRMISKDPAQLSAPTEWQNSMARAFAAPRFDDYFDRRMAVERALQKQLGSSAPFTLVDTMETYPLPQLEETKLYTNYKLAEGDGALAQGRIDQAIAMYQEPERFAQRLQSHARQMIEKLYAGNLQTESEARLAAALKLAHRETEADQLLKLIAIRNSQRPDFMNQGKFWEIVYGPVTAKGMVVSIASALVLVSFALILIGFGYLLTSRSFADGAGQARAPRWLDRMMIAAAQYSPLVLLTSCLSLYFAYRPFGTVFGRFMDGGLSPSETDTLRVFWQVRYVPSLVISALGGSHYLKIWAWMILIVLLLVPLSVIIWRWAPKRSADAVS